MTSCIFGVGNNNDRHNAGTVSSVPSILKKTNQSVITFRFANVENLSIEGFNHQNVLADIVFEPVEDSIRVKMEGTFGANIAFRCSTVTVQDVVRLKLF